MYILLETTDHVTDFCEGLTEILSGKYRSWNCGDLNEVVKMREELIQVVLKKGYKHTATNLSRMDFKKYNQQFGEDLCGTIEYSLEIIDVPEKTNDLPFMESMIISMREKLLTRINISELEVIEVYRIFEQLYHIERGTK